MSFIKKNILRSIVVPGLAAYSLSTVYFSCTTDPDRSQELHAKSSLSLQWYRQAMIDLGNRMHMISPNDGIAVSRGMGKEIQGKAYRYTNGQWIAFYEYPYSDYPLLACSDSSTIWTINHRTHEGSYRPILSEFHHGVRKEIPIPKIMWDDVDYVMFKGLHRFADGTAWLVGQQGHILYFNGSRWNEEESPLIHKAASNSYDGDLNDIAMTSKSSGWAVGRDGIIIRYSNNHWSRVDVPWHQTLHKIAMVNDSTGWAVGNSGTILECRNYRWQKRDTDIREHLFSVIALNEEQAWIVGNNSTFLSFEKKNWVPDESIKNYDDLFSDISVVKDTSGVLHFWVIGSQGIYTTSQSMGFSFTDITNQAGLRRTGKSAQFFFRSSSDMPDLLVANDGGSSLLYENNGADIFSDVTAKTALLHSPRDAVAMAVGDVNNDGEQDILQLIDHRNFKLYLGTASGGLREFSERSQLAFDEINSLTPIAAKFIDLNNDGNLDLYVSNYDLPDQMFIGDGSGKFSRYHSKTGINKILNHASYGAAFGDFNNDGRIDIFIPYYVSEHKKFFSLFMNNGGLNFSETDDSLFYSTTDLSPTAVAVADLNNDGNFDLYIHSQKIPPMLWLNGGKGTFKNISLPAGFTETLNHPEPINGIVGTGDVNNDGWIDLFDGSKLFLNSPYCRFTEVSERIGIQFTGTPTFADIDNDGDMDLFIGSSRGSLGKGDRASLFRNNMNTDHFIKVRITGDESNCSAIGAKVVLLNARGDQQTRMVGGGGSQLTVQSLNEVHFGVDSNRTYSVKVIFPSGKIKEVHDIRPGSIVLVVESNLMFGYYIRLLKSIQRTLAILTVGNVIQKIAALIVIILFLSIVGNKIGANKLITRWYSAAAVVTIFLAISHVSMYEHEIVSTVIAFLGTMTISLSGLFLGNAMIRKRETRYVSHFKILELLGAGGMGKVYKAIDSHTKQIVALKILNPELLNDPENRRRLSAEGYMLSSFKHPNIVKVIEIGESNERGYIAMEYLSGGTLREKLLSEHPLKISAIKKYIIQLCDGLSEVHQKNIVHRDVKTGNVMFDADGNLRIMDFGLSKSPLVTTMTSLGTVLGTLGYVAPEQVTGLNVDRRTDIFSLGVIMYELLTGELPFKGENEIALIHSIFNTIPLPPSQVLHTVPKEWDAIVLKCLSKNSSDRFGSAEEVKQQLLISCISSAE